MNGIFIKGASLPESCFVCPCMFGGLCFVCPPEQDGVIADTVDELCEKGGKPDWCPIVEAEIDKDELVRHGRWMYPFYCSVCGFEPDYSSDLTYNYCPDCGAKMVGGGDGP